MELPEAQNVECTLPESITKVQSSEISTPNKKMDAAKVKTKQSVVSKTTDIVKEMTKKMGIKQSKKLSRIIEKTTRDTLDRKVCSDLNMEEFKNVIDQNTVNDVVKSIVKHQRENPDISLEILKTLSENPQDKTHETSTDETIKQGMQRTNDDINEDGGCTKETVTDGEITNDCQDKSSECKKESTVKQTKKQRKKKHGKNPIKFEENLVTEAFQMVNEHMPSLLSNLNSTDEAGGNKDLVDSKTKLTKAMIQTVQESVSTMFQSEDMSKIMGSFLASEPPKKPNKKNKSKTKQKKKKEESSQTTEDENHKNEEKQPVYIEQKLENNPKKKLDNKLSREELSKRLKNRLQRLSDKRGHIMPDRKTKVEMDLSPEKLEILKKSLNSIGAVEKEESLMYICREYGDVVGERIRQAVNTNH